MSEIRIALVGTPEDLQRQIRILQSLHLTDCIAAKIHYSEHITASIIRSKVTALGITQVVCVGTKNGSTGFWAKDLSETCNPCPEIYGIDIPDHPLKIVHDGIKKVTMIKSISDIFKSIPSAEQKPKQRKAVAA